MSEIIKGYICMDVSKESTRKLQNFFVDRNLDCQNDLHTTIIHDDKLTFNPLDENYIKHLADVSEVYGKVIGGKILGEVDSKHRSPVIVVSSPIIEAIHEHLITNGYHHYYDDYIVHISINYGALEEDMDKYLSAIDELIGTTIVYDGINVEVVKPKED